MNWRTILTLCIIQITYFTMTSFAAAANPDIGKFEPATCPVDLPEGSDLGNRLEYGYITIPEQHARPGGPVIQLAVARFKSFSDNPAPDPLVLNTGGPGDSNMDQFIPMAAGPMGQALLAQRDVVIIELRGLRYSKPALICDEVFEAQISMIGKDIRGKEANQILMAGMRASYDRFQKEGINLSAYNNVETAADIAMIMTTLGYDKFNIFGSSAGTMVAQHVMRDYPQRVRCVVLNAAVPLGQLFFRNMMSNASESLERMFELCKSDEACNAAYPDMEEKFFAYLEQLNKEPVTIQVKHPGSGEEVNFVLNGDRLSTWIFASMYFNTQIPYTLSKFMAGDYSELQNSANIFFPMHNFSYGLSYSIFSSESMDFTVEDIEVCGRYSAFADGMSMFFCPSLLAQAQEFWKVKPLESSLLKPLKSDIPTLIFNGEMDHVLPTAYIKDMASNLSNGYMYLFPGIAHSPIDSGSCAFMMTMEFLADPTKAPDSACMEQFKHEFRIEK
jgi:pimeloyl-ACP methyl ester carboxylesterase